MGGSFFLCRGIARDLRNRLPYYPDDWSESVQPGRKRRIAAASTYIFFASAIPALAFGQQFYINTDGVINIVHVLVSTAIAGVTQSLMGGQPLLILGVAEPIVLVYGYMYDFAKGQRDLQYGSLFLPWASWCCMWTAGFLMALAVVNSCSYISRFTRFAGELFGMLIAVLFLQQAVKGLIDEFNLTGVNSDYSWRLVNGLWSLFLACGLLLTSLLMRTARCWRFLFSPVRAFLADYGVPVMIVAWSGISFAVSGVPAGIPNRVSTPDTWNVTGTWSVVSRLGQVPGTMIAAAIVPALIMTVLFFFDHNVSSQMAQQPEFNLRKPPAYHWDFMLLGVMELACGLLGIPPVNGVLPQAPMHTKSLSKLMKSWEPDPTPATCETAQSSSHEPPVSADLANGAQGGGEDRTCNGVSGTANGKGAGAEEAEARQGTKLAQEGEVEWERGTTAQQQQVQGESVMKAEVPNSVRQQESLLSEEVIRLQVTEQRASNLLQSLGVALCLAITPAIRLIPSAVLWGYFAFMAIESLPGSQFWDRLLLLLTDPKRRYVLLERGHAPYLETVPFKVIVSFTLLQCALLGAVYGLTWAGIAGILFPIPIMLLVPFRQWVMPRMFRKEFLEELDSVEAKEAPPVEHEDAVKVAGAGEEEDESEVIGDEMVHYQIKHHISRDSLEQRAPAGLECVHVVHTN